MPPLSSRPTIRANDPPVAASHLPVPATSSPLSANNEPREPPVLFAKIGALRSSASTTLTGAVLPDGPRNLSKGEHVKKSYLKRLVLNRETLLELDRIGLEGVAGDVTVRFCDFS